MTQSSPAPSSGPAISSSGAVATGGSQITMSGSLVSGRDLLIDKLTILMADRAPAPDGLVIAGHANDVCPYPGIEAFTAADARFFHGRDEDVRQVCDLVAPGVLAAVIGSSGSGKSSLLAAAVVPSLAAGTGDRPRWHPLTLRPGRTPLLMIGERLAGLIPGSSAVAIAEQIAADPEAFRVLSSRAAQCAGRPVVWVVDQFEEVFAPGVAQAGGSAMLEALRPGPGYAVLLCMRSDFYAQLDASPELARLVAASQHRLTPLTEEAIRAAALLPAQQVGLRVQPELLTVIASDARRSGGALPFIAVALQETWERRENGWLTVEGYLRGGGVARAIELTADSAWQRLPGKDQDTARRMLLRMADIAADGTATRRTCLATEFVTGLDDEDAVVRVLAVLVGARLLTMDQGRTASDGEGRPEPTVDIAHEALFHAWPLLRAWLVADRDLKRLQDDLAESAAAWTGSGRDPAFLVTGGRLAALVSAGSAIVPNQNERAFIAASRRLAARQRIRGRALVVLPLALAAALVVTGLTVLQERATARAKTQADALQSAAQARAELPANRDLAVLLAVAADRTAHSPTTWGALVDAAGTAQGPAALIRQPGAVITALAPAVTAGGAAVMGSSDHRILTAVSGRPSTLARAEGAVSQLASDSGAILSADDRGNLDLLLPGRPGIRLSAGSKVWSVALDRRSGLIAAAGVDGRLHRWWFTEGPGGQSTQVTRTSVEPISTVSLAVAAPGGLVAAGLDGSLWSLPARGPARRLAAPGTLTGGPGIRIALTRDRRLAAIDGRDLRIWTLGSTLTRAAAAGLAGASAISADPLTGDVLIGTTGGEISHWSVREAPARQSTLFGYGGQRITGLATDGKWLFALRPDGPVASWDLSGEATPVAARLPVPSPNPLSAAYRADGLLATGTASGEVVGYPPGTGPGAASGAGPGGAKPLGSMAGTPATALIWWGDRLVAGGADGRVEVVSPRQQRLSAPRGTPVSGLAAAGDRLAIGWEDGRVVLVEPSGSFRVLSTGTSSRALALSPDGSWLASGTAESPEAVILLWDLRRGGPPRRLTAHTLFVSALAFSPDSSHLASGGDDLVIRIWPLGPAGSAGPGGQVHPSRTLRGHQDTVRALAYSRDGHTLASAGDEGSIMLWDISTGAQIGHPLPVTRDRVLGLAASPDGHQLVAVGGGQLVSYPFDQRSWQTRACAFAGRDLTPDERARYLAGRPQLRPCPSA